MDPLTQTLLQRQLNQPQPPTNPVVPPNPQTKLPPEAKRFNNAQQIEQAYAGGWATNPVILRAMLGHR